MKERRLRFLSVLTAAALVLLAAPPRTAVAAVASVRMDMQSCDGDTTMPIDEPSWNGVAIPSVVGSVHEVCATSFDEAGEHEPSEIVFTIADGPGRFTDDAGADLGDTVTVPAGTGLNKALVTSTTAGTTTITARSGAITATGTKGWASGTARVVTLGAPSGSPSSSVRTIAAFVSDGYGNAVPGAAVDFQSSGAGHIASATPVSSASDGRAVVTLERDAGQAGTQAVTASLDPDHTDCERAAGDPAGLPAGSCQAGRSVDWGAATSSLSIGAAPHLGVVGTTFTVIGSLTVDGSPLAGRTVAIDKREGFAGPFVPAGNATTGEDGRFRLTAKPWANTEYRATFAGDASVGGSQSGIAKVWVRVGIILNVTPRVTLAGRAVTFTGKIVPAHPGSRVMLQQFSPSSGWRTIVTTTLDSGSSYRIRVAKRTPGWLLFRTIFASHGDHVWNVSTNRRVDWT